MQLTDLPRDPNSHLSTIRAPLVKLVNAARHSESKSELLRATLRASLAELGDVTEKPSETPEKALEAKPKRAPKKRATAKVKKDEVTTDTST